ncbi:MAG: DUF998 domain-containing protein [Candidatus Methanofastidiosia archaeon]
MAYTNRKTAGTLIFFGCVQFFILLLIAEAVYPDYSISKDYISLLGTGKTGYIFNFAVALFGVTILACTYYIHKEFQFKVFTVFLALTGIGALGVGLFPMDSIEIIHAIAALFAFLFGGLSAIVSYKLGNRPFSYFSVALGVMSLVALGLFICRTCLGIGIGGMERMVAYPVVLWGVGFGGSLMSDGK